MRRRNNKPLALQKMKGFKTAKTFNLELQNKTLENLQVTKKTNLRIKKPN